MSSPHSLPRRRSPKLRARRSVPRRQQHRRLPVTRLRPAAASSRIAIDRDATLAAVAAAAVGVSTEAVAEAAVSIEVVAEAAANCLRRNMHRRALTAISRPNQVRWATLTLFFPENLSPSSGKNQQAKRPHRHQSRQQHRLRLPLKRTSLSRKPPLRPRENPGRSFSANLARNILDRHPASNPCPARRLPSGSGTSRR